MATAPPAETNPWADPPADGEKEEQTAFGAVSSAAGAAGAAVTSTIAKTPFAWILYMMRVVNILNAVLLGVAGVFSFALITGPNSFTLFFIAVYIVLFAALLLIFELRVGAMERYIKKRFGFLFTYWGRTCFLIFCGLITFAMLTEHNKDQKTPRHWVMAAGIVTMVNAAANCLVICTHPAFQGKDDKEMSADDMAKYMAAHPDVAQRAHAIVAEEQQPAPSKVDFGAGPAAQREPRASPPAPSAPSAYQPPAVAAPAPADPFSSPAPSPAAAPTPAPAAAPQDDGMDNPFADDNPFA